MILSEFDGVEQVGSIILPMVAEHLNVGPKSLVIFEGGTQ